MPYNFQFSFLGCQHNYLARVTMISADGFPQDDSFTETYGLPIAFARQMNDGSHRKRFFFNVRGHDFLSYSGQWKGKGKNKIGHVETAFVPVSESSTLEILRRKNEESEFLGVNMIASFGPRPGSIFVDAYSLKRYKWAKLPSDLEDEIQSICSEKGYDKGVIHELTMNSTGGWVILLDEGKRFAFGGQLPFDLVMALRNKQESKRQKPKLDISIYRIYLNHQHPEEYVLIFGDGECFISLHSEFRDPMNRLLTKWASGHPKFHFNFRSSCNCSYLCQKSLNASYYSRRGLFFLSRLNVNMAIQYLREALSQDSNNLQIRNQYYLAIIAMRRHRGTDSVLDDMITHRPIRTSVYRPSVRQPDHQDEHMSFRNEYMWMLEDQDINLGELERQLNEIQRPFLDGKWNLYAGAMMSEWSNDLAIAGEKPHELEIAEQVHGNGLDRSHEMEAEVFFHRTDTQISELSSSWDEGEELKVIKQTQLPRRQMIRSNIPVHEPPKSKNPLTRFKKWSE